MSIKTMLGILQVAIQKKLAENRILWNKQGPLTSPVKHQYHRGYFDALNEVNQELDKIYEMVQEEGL